MFNPTGRSQGNIPGPYNPVDSSSTSTMGAPLSAVGGGSSNNYDGE